MGSKIDYPFDHENINEEEIVLPLNKKYETINNSHKSNSKYVYLKYYCERKNKKFINKEKFTLFRCDVCLCIPFIRIEPYINKINIILKCNCGVKNISLYKLIKQYKSNPIINLCCSKHLENEADKYCVNCKIFLCKYCNLWHSKKFEKFHQIKCIDSIFIKCMKHNKSYFGFCNSCKVNICNSCYEHENHSIVVFERYMKLMNIKEKKNKILTFENKIIPYYYGKSDILNNKNKLIKKSKQRNLEIINLLKFLNFIYDYNSQNLNFQILYNIDMNSVFNYKYFNRISMNFNLNYVIIQNPPKILNAKPLQYYNNYEIELKNNTEKEKEIITSKTIDFILLLKNGNILLFSNNIILLFEDETFLKKKEIELASEPKNIVISKACEMYNNGKIIYICDLKYVLFSLIDYSNIENIRTNVIINIICLPNNYIIIQENNISINIIKSDINGLNIYEEKIEFDRHLIGRILSINSFEKTFVVEMLHGIYNSYNNDTLVLNKTFSINNTLSSSMPAIKFDENTLITFNGELNIHYFNILDIKTMQFIAKIYLNYNYFNRINAFKLPDGNILILMNNITFSVYDGVSYNLLMKRNIYYSSSSMIMTNKGKLICATKPSDLKIFEYSNLYYN